MSKETYFVIWKEGTNLTLSKHLADPQMVHYKVALNEYQHKKLSDKIDEISKGDVMPEHIFVSPFDETRGDQDKYSLGEDEDDLFHMIYNFGTEETRAHLKANFDKF
ncbi:hypothetical protein [Salisediminibacterium selenitireducens]|uniref:Uncharacterized protein n=1 Tax=Bacillus selenitireducens (strain ATCC 700615 / DSM 15326 / MLS10) TaxID=439292 RepID=D6XXS6_BACIE|nr:hypothetical protein [Salisediminibacterium selenitireducens]ADI00119.1 hypothetical protein Bsel_2619 [[Bacillus] selenitireducens MLS10]